MADLDKYYTVMYCITLYYGTMKYMVLLSTTTVWSFTQVRLVGVGGFSEGLPISAYDLTSICHIQY